MQIMPVLLDMFTISIARLRLCKLRGYSMTDQSKTALIPLELLEAYVALQRAVEQAMSTERYNQYDSVSRFYFKASPEFRAIAAASIAIDKLTQTEEGK